MKKQSNNLFATIGKVHLQNLTSMVKETLATGLSQPKAKIFTTTDLWNIHRQAKCRVQRRFNL